jgi:adenylate cyclase
MAANSDAPLGKRLDSWKEIAAYLGRGERTVKRWETERKLPVHRVPGGGRSAVFAYAGELTEWLKGKSHELESDSVSSKTAQAQAAAAQAAPVAGSPPLPVPLTRGLTSNRLAALLVPPVLAAGLVLYFSLGQRGSRVTALSDAQRADTAVLNPSLGSDSVAVLPFTNVRGNPDADYLIDGVTESLIGNLARLPQLKVRSRDAVFRYKGRDLDVRRTGSELGVSVLVTGRVMVQGDNIEVSVELTRVPENTEMWGQRYTGKSANLIAIQQRMAGDIAKELRSTLSNTEKQRVARQGTQNAQAYSLYLKGRYAWNKRTRADLETAISHFNQAIDQDPEYALAYSGLADVYSVLHYWGGNPREDFPKSNAAARRALELDPTLAHPHAVLGSNEIDYDWDFAGGQAEFAKAIELDPNDATAHQWYAEKLSALARHQEAIAQINRARELDPLSPVVTRVVGGILVTAGHYDQGIAICKQLAQENPTFAIAHDCLFYAYWDKRMYPQAMEEFKVNAELMRDPENAENAAAMERGFRSSGWPGAQTQLISVFENRRKNGYASPFMIARLYADVGNREKAFEWLDIAYREHDCLLIELNSWVQFDDLRLDPRFAALVRKIGLPVNENSFSEASFAASRK